MENSNLNYLKNLNKSQRESIINLDGPCLIVAGAGSGKTKVLTTRAAHIIKKKKAWPSQILCVTFTNKAAREMQNRVSKLLQRQATGIPWLGTFHSISAKILRRHAAAVHLNSNFTIIDRDDQLRLIKNICKSEKIDVKLYSPQIIIAIIDRWINKGLTPKKVIPKKGDGIERGILNIYKIYQEKILNLNACDFGDLILHCVSMFENQKEIL